MKVAVAVLGLASLAACGVVRDRKSADNEVGGLKAEDLQGVWELNKRQVEGKEYVLCKSKKQNCTDGGALYVRSDEFAQILGDLYDDRGAARSQSYFSRARYRLVGNRLILVNVNTIQTVDQEKARAEVAAPRKGQLEFSFYYDNNLVDQLAFSFVRSENQLSLDDFSRQKEEEFKRLRLEGTAKEGQKSIDPSSFDRHRRISGFYRSDATPNALAMITADLSLYILQVQGNDVSADYKGELDAIGVELKDDKLFYGSLSAKKLKITDVAAINAKLRRLDEVNQLALELLTPLKAAGTRLQLAIRRSAKNTYITEFTDAQIAVLRKIARHPRAFINEMLRVANGQVDVVEINDYINERFYTAESQRGRWFYIPAGLTVGADEFEKVIAEHRLHLFVDRIGN